MSGLLRIPALWCAMLALALGIALPLSAARAQDQAPAPVQLSNEQVNQIVQSVTDAVLKQMKAGQPAAEQPAADQKPADPVTSVLDETAKPVQAIEGGIASFVQDEEFQVVENFQTTIESFPSLAREVRSIIVRIDHRPQGRGPLGFLGLVAGIFVLAAAVGYAATFLAARLLPGAPPQGGPAGVGEVLRRAAANLLGFGAFVVVTSIASHTLFKGVDIQSQVGHWMLTSGAQFALFYAVFLIFFRPTESAYRIVPLDSGDAKLAMRLFCIVLGILVLRSWIIIPMNDRQPERVIAAGLLVNNFLFVSSFFLAAWPARGAIRRWIENTTMSGRASAPRRWLAANWFGITGCSVLLLSVIHALGAVTGHNNVVTGLTGTVRTVIVMVLICAFVEFVGRRSERADQVAKRAIPKLPGLVSQMLRVFVVLGAGIYFIRLWFVDALQVMSPERWSHFASYAVEPLLAACGGYLAVSYINYLSARYLAMHPVIAPRLNEDGTPVSSSDSSSRLRTLIPIMRVTSIVIIVVMISLLVLSHLGFNITPLLAGASVIGLAISFGSQALVKDIVSGILFLAEDSFRVGEFIECGNSKGTVDGFTLRSIRLRHPEGQIYTVPFGQIGEIINYSRDWATVKFNMSLDRDVDLDDVRAVVKKVAADIKTDFKDRVLDSLKVQGVKDVTDTAIVVQFMFTSLPRDPGEIERAARSRLLKAFKDEGIALSRPGWMSPTVMSTANV